MLIEILNGITPFEAFEGLRGLHSPFFLTYGPVGNRYSAMSADPRITIEAVHGTTTVEGGDFTEGVFKDPFEAASRILRLFKDREKGPLPFSVGGVGYFAYDLKDLIEPGRFHTHCSLHIPECVFGFYDPVFIYRHRDGMGFLMSSDDDRARLDEFKNLILGSRGKLKESHVPKSPGFSSNMTKEEYIGAILKAKEYISAGDIYQINLSQRLKIPYGGDPFALYMELVKNSPAPYTFFLDYRGFKIISHSPERLLKVKDCVLETSPIKGTRPRGNTPDEDAAMIEELKESIKERAEHVMIVDLERNDLGRVSEPGTVEVDGFESIETFPALHHMVSTVRGRLRPGISAPEALRAIFPGGSVTGAPKIRAMEIIEELEPTSRGLYTGAVGWLDHTGNMDMAMAIRTAIYKDGFIYLNVGGGIVADSVPEDEYMETLLKAKDFFDVLGISIPGD
ncbi:MAG: aminodeoxychorismate synthase component I [Deltaproteobacteria bacterium]|nr:aminodeoxychorismate synthase component I [Deltaproteobacteria bacterium]